MNILTFDIEEWFQLLDFDATRTEKEWDTYPVRIYENVDRILDILDETNTKATFMIIGWVAKKYPDIVKKIAEKYEIGSHTMNHQLVWQQTQKEFKQDVDTSIKLLQDITGQSIECFRAPGFSIRESESWAFDILSNLGIKFDLSVFPTSHAHGGMSSYKTPIPSIIKHGNNTIKEFPITTKTLLGKRVAFSGGGYFRLFPYFLIKKWSKEAEEKGVECNNQFIHNNNSTGYLLSYIHPRDLDGGQPMLQDLPITRKFKSYVGTKEAEKKLRQYLNDFSFTDVATAAKMINWEKAPIIEI